MWFAQLKIVISELSLLHTLSTFSQAHETIVSIKTSFLHGAALQAG